MRIRVVLPQKEAKRVRPKMDDLLAKVVDEQWAGDLELVCNPEPNLWNPYYLF
jgi:hypothetical protein